FPDQATAEREAGKIARKLDQGIMPGLLLNGRERLIYERAQEMTNKLGLDLDVLVATAADARSLLGDVSLVDAARFYVEHRLKVCHRTVAEVVAELVSDRLKNGKSATYIRDLRSRLGRFADVFCCPISSVDW